MTNLRILKFSHTSKLRDEQFQQLSSLSQLECLKFALPKKAYAYTFIGKCLEPLQNLKELKLFNFNGITEKVIRRLPVSLTSLGLRECSLLDYPVIEGLSRLTSLTLLDLSKCSNIDDDLINIISQTNPSLRRLTLRECRGVTNRSAPHLAHLTQLDCLDLTHTKFSNSGLKYLSTLTSLQSLVLQRCTTINDTGIPAISTLTNLTSLNLYSCTNITDKSLEALTQMTMLCTLNLSYCKNITNAGLFLLSTILVNLTELYLYGCNIRQIDKRIVNEMFPKLKILAGLIQLKEVRSD
jgi:hypothetical protein